MDYFSVMSKRKYKSEYLKFGFGSVVNKNIDQPQCLLCLKVYANESMKPKIMETHLNKEHPEHAEKPLDFFIAKESSAKKRKIDQHRSFGSAERKRTEFSYDVSLMLAQLKKPHTLAEELVKPILLKAGSTFGDKNFYEEIKKVPLSNDTVKRRIADMAQDVSDQLIDKVKASPFFALQLDESTDVVNISQLMIFVRYLDVEMKEMAEEYLICIPLTLTTKAQDVMENVDSFFEKNGLSWDKLIAICSDGAPAMMGSRSGFISLVKNKNNAVIGTHCFIHREALATKTLPQSLSQVLSGVIKVVNYIKNHASQERFFKKMCLDLESDHTSLLYFTRVRWLSCGNMLTRVLNLFTVIKTFLEIQGKTELLSLLNEEVFLKKMSYLVDFFEILNQLNLKLQGKQSNIMLHSDIISAFIERIELIKNKLENGNLSLLPNLQKYFENVNGAIDNSFKNEIMSHLVNIIQEFKRYFPEIDTMSVAMKFTRNPFKNVTVEDLPDELQEEFISFKNESFIKDNFENKSSLVGFWEKTYFSFPAISKFALKVLMPFSSTYLCESAFSTLLYLKNKYRNRLESEADCRLALSNIKPNIKELVDKIETAKSRCFFSKK